MREEFKSKVLIATNSNKSIIACILGQIKNIFKMI